MKLLWNREGTACAIASKIREFQIQPSLIAGRVVVWGFYKKHDSFRFGEFDDIVQAREFIKDMARAMKIKKE